HGERIVYVNPGESREGIEEILQGTDHAAARATIAAERKSRDSLCYAVHDPKKWGTKLDEIERMLDVLAIPVSIIN
ncbi:MAG: hypothetical protein ACTSU5_21115, partial [Promethearchaeota archaeon]